MVCLCAALSFRDCHLLYKQWKLLARQKSQFHPAKEVVQLGQGLIAAVKSDTFSILTFEIGLFAWMALTFFVFFPHPHLNPTEPGYWFMMQLGMILGFFTSYPMNRWLIKAGWKEAMG